MDVDIQASARSDMNIDVPKLPQDPQELICGIVAFVQAANYTTLRLLAGKTISSE
jgi:hypothetical protein